ncbi:MAG TPA: pyruvate kinase, partial [Candidatus Dojkabacteria bacterium]|nr:pyruvate kinase [Candidatus Dojkabacteria bacterium]
MEIPTAAKKSRGIKTKIVATIGPATWDDNVLKKMIGNGMRVVRVNASFADYDEFLRVTTQIRSLSTDVSLLLDTMGHKIRVTGFKDSIEVKTGEQICLTYQGGKHHKEYKTIEVTYNHIVRDMTRNATILIDDG